MQLKEREKKIVAAGAVIWGIILLIFFIALPWHDKRKAESSQQKLQLNKLQEIKVLVNREAQLAARENLILGRLVNQKELYPYGRQIVEVQSALEKIAKSKKIKITDTRPVKTAVMREDLGLRKATIRLAAISQNPKVFSDFFVDLDSMPGLLNLEEFHLENDPKKKGKGITFNLTVSTLVKEGK